MFIEITTPANPLRIENALRPYKRGEKNFSPEVAEQILSMTNNKKNIYDMLSIIATLSKDEQIKYKKIVLSTFDHRKQPTETTILAQKLALTNDYEDELNQTINHDPMTDTEDGVIYASATNKIVGYICADERPDLSKLPENATIYCTKNKVKLYDVDLSQVKTLKFKRESEIYLQGCKNLPADLDVSMCDKVKLCNVDLSQVKTLKFKGESEIYLQGCKNLPADLDVSMCDKVDLVKTDLSLVKALKFKEGSMVYLFFSKNLPADLDVSKCDKVCLEHSDFSQIKNLKFKEGSIVFLYAHQNLPEDLDVSMCDKVKLYDVDLSQVKTLKFKGESEIYLQGCKNLPADLDVSMCDSVYLDEVDLSQVKTLKFKNRDQQKESSVRIPDDWQGEITYTDEQRFGNLFTKLKKLTR